MNNLNLLVAINAYSDTNPSNNPTLNNTKWSRNLIGIDVNNTESHNITLSAGQGTSLFSGAIPLSSDATTTWNIILKSGTTNTYKISYNTGTLPVFRTARTSGASATTEVTVTKNAKLLTFTSTGGTLFALIANGVVVGDQVRISTLFNTINQGLFTILSRTATSFTIENETGLAEGPIILGAGFSTQVNIYSASGVYIGDKIDITDGFSSVTWGTYDITDVSHDYIEFYTTESLPTESAVSNNPAAFSIYRNCKQFVYIESDQKLDIRVNGSSITNYIEPIQIGTTQYPGIFMSTSSIKSIVVDNISTESADVFYITAE
ncbi:MAG: hypothetical protein PHF86_10200 [Candidatus Nanoarchaeia archaeon]|nr:hypothetical protein [Candidatus Nanoarchaeia archaeon]